MGQGKGALALILWKWDEESCWAEGDFTGRVCGAPGAMWQQPGEDDPPLALGAWLLGAQFRWRRKALQAVPGARAHLSVQSCELLVFTQVRGRG